MIEVTFQSISAGDIKRLVDIKRRESKTIEYKEQLPGGRDEDRKEFLADVSSFANASGGDLLYGVSEERDANDKPTGIPKAAKGIAKINAGNEILRLESMIRDGVEPRIPGLQIKAIEGFEDGPVILIRIPKSWVPPHMVSFKASPRFFSRTSAGKSPLDVSEIRAAFVQSESLPEKIRRFRENRLGNILARETPVPIPQDPLVVLHLVPIAAFHAQMQIDVLPFLHKQIRLTPMAMLSDWDGRLNLDGYVSFSGNAVENTTFIDYVQLFRNGVIEAVGANGYLVDRAGSISSTFESDIVKGTTQYFKVYRELEIEGPVVAMLSLLYVRGLHMNQPGYTPRRSHPIDRQHLLIPEIVIEDLNVPVATSLRPIFDLVWQACGRPRSANYDDQGNWNLR